MLLQLFDSMNLIQLFTLSIALFLLVSCEQQQTDEIATPFPIPIKDTLFSYFPSSRIDTISRIDSFQVNRIHVPCCEFGRAEISLYFDEEGHLIGSFSIPITSSSIPTIGIERSRETLTRHFPDNPHYSFFFEDAHNKCYYYDSTQQKLIELRNYSDLELSDQWEWEASYIRAGKGTPPNVYWGLLDKKTLKPLCDFKYVEIKDFEDGVAKVFDNYGHIGLINTKGEEVIPCFYDRVYLQEKEGWIAVEKGGFYGLWDSLGRELIPCNYTGIIYFENGWAIVEQNERYGLLNRNQQMAAPCPYRSSEFSDAFAQYSHQYYSTGDVMKLGEEEVFFEQGIAIVYHIEEKGYGLINSKGEALTSFEYEDIRRDWKTGLLFIQKKEGYGLMDSTGKVLLPCIHSTIDIQEEEDFMIASTRKIPQQPESDDHMQYTLYNYQGKAISKTYDEIDFTNDGFIIAELDNKAVLLNLQGKEVSSYYDFIIDDHPYDNYYIVMKGKKKAVMNEKGRIISDYYDNVDRFYDDYFVVTKGKKRAVLDKKGKVITNYYDDIDKFTEGYFIVVKENKRGAVDLKGKEVTNYYTDILSFYDGYFIVLEGKKRGIIDKQGKEILPCLYNEMRLHKEDNLIVVATMEVSQGSEPVYNVQYQMCSYKGKVISKTYDHIKYFRDYGFAYATLQDKHVMLNKQGKEISNYYEKVQGFSKGYAVMTRGGKKGIVDIEGNEVIPCRYKNITRPLISTPPYVEFKVWEDNPKEVKIIQLPVIKQKETSPKISTQNN